MTLMIVLTCLNGLLTVISCWYASRSQSHRAMAQQSLECAQQQALIAKTSADILSTHSRAVAHNWPEASGR